jgi:predicted ABC-type ATPase
MRVVAGPIASGKTGLFFRAARAEEQLDAFNVDDRCAEINSGSYQSLPEHVIRQAMRECEEFIREHISRRRSFMIETTLRTTIALDQARQARMAGFFVEMIFVATEDPEINVRRAEAREMGGGRDVLPATVREVYAASLKNLERALRELDRVAMFDNSPMGQRPTFQAEVVAGCLESSASTCKVWVRRALSAAGIAPERRGE